MTRRNGGRIGRRHLPATAQRHDVGNRAPIDGNRQSLSGSPALRLRPGEALRRPCSEGLGRRWSGPTGQRSTDSHTEPGGDDGTRTHDPLLAKQVLFQLSYVPSSVTLVPAHSSTPRRLREALLAALASAVVVCGRETAVQLGDL